MSKKKNFKQWMELLDQGKVRIVDLESHEVNIEAKEAILEYFRKSVSKPMNSGVFQYFDKIPLKKRPRLKGVRVIPGAVIRYGAYIESGAIVMPSLINVGAYVGTGTMIDTWATVGSCAQIGANVHISGGVGIGGVLEPAQAMPVVIEEGSFIGSRAILVEGIHIEKEVVIGAGVTLTASTKIIDVRGTKPEIHTGRVPARSVVIPGTYSKNFPAGDFGVPCALIIGTRKHSTDLKTSLNQALREHQVAI